MKKFYAMILALVFILTAANVAVLDNSKATGYDIRNNADNYLEIDFSVGELTYSDIETERGVFAKLEIEKGYVTRNEGSPALPAMHEMIAMPYGAEPSVEVISYEKKVYSLKELGIENPVFPAQPSYSKSSKPEDIKFVYNESAYMSSKFNDGVLAEVSKSGTMRGVGVGVLKVYPFKYNPTEGTVEVYNDLKVRVNFKGAAADSKQKAVEEYSPYFESAMSQLINYKSPALDSKADLMSYPVTYLIVAAQALNGNADLNRLVDWKTEKGFNVIVNYVATSATISANDSWVETQYNTLNPKPSFVLLVGDMDGTYAVMTETAAPLGGSNVEASDLAYGVIGSVSSSNRIPSMYLGRFSVRSTGDLTAQVDKTIWYEKEQFTTSADLTYLTAPLGIAGVDSGFGASHGNPQITYGWMHYFTAANGMNNALYHLYPATTNSAVDAEIISHISAGSNFYNYTAHGMPTYFADPGFYISDIDGLNNAGEYPLVVGNCCLTNTFNNIECFGEAWLNAPNKGAIGYIGASMSTYWDEDLTMGVGTVATSQEPPPLDTSNPGMYDGVMALGYSSQAAVKHVGLMAVETLNTGFTDDYWGSYHLMGDPSVQIYFGIPGTMTASHDGMIAPGATTYSVTTTPYAYVAMGDQNGNLHGAARANSSGVAVVPVTAYTVGDTGKLVITAQFKQPYFEDVLCSGATGGDYSINTNNIDYGYVTVGGNSTMQFTITNSHSTEYMMGDITTISGYTVANAAKNTLSFAVPPNDSKTFDLVFSPTAQTTYSGNITITTTDPSNPTKYLAVSGSGAYPDISVPSGTAAAAEPGGSVSDSFVISNTGTSGLNYSLSNSYVGALIPGGNWAANDFTTFPGTGWTNSGWVASSGAARATGATATCTLTSPVFDTSGAGNPVYLDFTQNYFARTGSWTRVEYYTGSAWVEVYYGTASTTTAQHIELSVKSASTQVRFTAYTTRSQAQTAYWDIDNILVSAEEIGYSWLTFNSPTSGLVAGGGSNTIGLTYNSAGLPVGAYESNVTVNSDDPDEPAKVVLVEFTVGGSTPPGAPIYIDPPIQGNILQWEAVSGATSYDVYSSTDPYGTFTFVTNVTGTQYTMPMTETKMFYYVVAKN